MKCFPKVTQYVSAIMGVLGSFLVITTLFHLIDYHKYSEKYIEQVDPLVDRIVNGSNMPEDSEYHLQLQEFFATKLSKEEFGQHIGMINRSLTPNPAPISAEERTQLWSTLKSFRFRMESKNLPEHPDYWIYCGMGLLFASYYLQKKLKPTPVTPPPPAQLWNDAPPPTI